MGTVFRSFFPTRFATGVGKDIGVKLGIAHLAAEAIRHRLDCRGSLAGWTAPRERQVDVGVLLEGHLCVLDGVFGPALGAKQMKQCVTRAAMPNRGCSLDDICADHTFVLILLQPGDDVRCQRTVSLQLDLSHRHDLRHWLVVRLLFFFLGTIAGFFL